MIVSPAPPCVQNAPDPAGSFDDQPTPYPWHMMPADPRDRALVLAVAHARGIDLTWAASDIAPIEELEQRVDELENVVLSLLAGRGAAT